MTREERKQARRRDAIYAVLVFAAVIGAGFAAEAVMPSVGAEEARAGPVRVEELAHRSKAVREDAADDEAYMIETILMEDERIEAALLEQGYYREDVPLDFLYQDILQTACEAQGVPYELALAVIERESGFDVDAVNPTTGCYGLMQLNPKYFPSGLTPAENITAGVAYLGELLDA